MAKRKRPVDIPLVISVRHSGTHTVREIVCGPDYKKRMRKFSHFADARTGDNCHVHFFSGWQTSIIAWAKEFKNAIIPIRDPRAIAITWHVRSHRDGWISEWECMRKIVRDIDCFLCPVENVPYKALENYLGRKVYRVDEPKGSRGTYTLKKMYQRGEHEAIRQIVPSYKIAESMIRDDEIASQFYD